ncbi:SGNH/GDSL hydrolase family protein [Mycobacterium sp. 1423905.2]|uniref:SGNH/GDSL hydrolase family protein n=1 Tax=Mycobacterium sp. 1423905.2 TaxID=1856859 RepID=UPI0007FFC722|nr:SGNH/GDSL hydrolase family protein [Mycobacterium sp. 1423905.2]OBJ60392.1 hydrolase [Mycobacterium sp. 1423905.2]
MKRYVALGSSMAAGPGIRPRAAGSPRRAGRSARNYPHLVAQEHGFQLVDVTYSGATTADVLANRQHGAPPQVAALDGSESLVTITIGGNDVGYIPLLVAASLPTVARRVPLLGKRICPLLDRGQRQVALAEVFDALCSVGRAVRERAPDARVLFVDYLTVLPPAGVPAPPLSEADAALGRHVAATLEQRTAEAAETAGCEIVRAGAASRDHHAWSTEAWTTKPGVPVPAKPAPLHPNGAGMRAVARLIAAAL